MDVVINIFKPFRRILFAVLAIYVGMIAMMMFLETSMVYPVPPRSAGEWNPDRLGHEEVDFRSADGTRLHGWFLEHPEPVATLLMCHGNGEHVAFLADEMAFLSARLKVNVMVFDYRGYGKSAGTPFERGILADAEAAQRWLAERTSQSLDDLILFGRSLGGAVCVHLAAKHGARGLVLDRTFSSLVDVAAIHMRWLPVRLLMRNRYPAKTWIREYSGPLLQIHGAQDQVVPISLGRLLFDLSPSSQKKWISSESLDHNSPWPLEYYHEVETFIRSSLNQDGLDHMPRGDGVRNRFG